MRSPAALTGVVLATLAAAPAEAKDVRLAANSTSVRALTAAGSDAIAVVDSTSVDLPFQVVKSSGGSAQALGRFGHNNADDPDLAADPSGRALLSWTLPVSGGIAVFVQPLPAAPNRARTRESQLILGTGTGVIAVDGKGAAVITYPDSAGDVAIARTPQVAQPTRGPEDPYDLPNQQTLTKDAPERRHRPVDMALTLNGPFVLDLIQRRGATSLKVHGPKAPTEALVTVKGLHDIPATLAADEDTIAVAYKSGGKVILATARSNSWSRRILPGATTSQPAEGAPAVALDAGSPTVAWTRRVTKANRDLYAFADGRTRRLTRTRGDDSAPYVAARADGGVWLAWTRRDGTRRTPLLRPLG